MLWVVNTLNAISTRVIKRVKKSLFEKNLGERLRSIICIFCCPSISAKCGTERFMLSVIVKPLYHHLRHKGHFNLRPLDSSPE